MKNGIRNIKGKILLSFISMFLVMVNFSLLAKGEESHRLGKADASFSFKSEAHNIAVSLDGKKHFMALNKIQHWDLVLKHADGTPVSNAEISFDGGMPSHGHGLPTTPKVIHQQGNEFLIRGVKFSMSGVWELYVDIKVEDKSVRLTLEIDLQYGKDVKILSSRFS